MIICIDHSDRAPKLLAYNPVKHAILCLTKIIKHEKAGDQPAFEEGA